MVSKGKKHKLSINFTDKYIDVYYFLKTQPNISNYICQTIKLQMNHDNEDYIEKKIREIIMELLGNDSLQLIPSNTPPHTPGFTSTDIGIAKEDVDLIKNLF